MGGCGLREVVCGVDERVLVKRRFLERLLECRNVISATFGLASVGVFVDLDSLTSPGHARDRYHSTR